MELAAVSVSPDAPIHEAVARIDRARSGAVVVLDAAGCLVGVVTDGDVRRGVLAHLDFTLPVQRLLDRRPHDLYPEPIAAAEGTAVAERIAIMRRHRIRHLPILDAEQRVVAFDRLDDLLETPLPVRAVVMAGGFGRRLRPLTDDVPKPLLPIGDRPILDYVLSHIAEAGIRDVTIATHYRGDLIKAHCRSGEPWSVQIRYVDEEAPLGTAGALRRLPASEEPLFVINGDILTRVDVRQMLGFHREHGADLTVGIRALQTQVPYGVVEVHGADVVGVLEKPTTDYFINAGVYVLERSALRWLPDAEERADMPDLVTRLLAAGRRVVGFPVREYWLDIGHPDQYAQAQLDVAEGRF
jgi:dTDP-glucose pyrophosphorylase